jgi:hypothetical protein
MPTATIKLLGERKNTSVPCSDLRFWEKLRYCEEIIDTVPYAGKPLGLEWE